MLQNRCLVAKIGVDTAENELPKVCRSEQAIPTPGHKSGSDDGTDQIRGSPADGEDPFILRRRLNDVADLDPPLRGRRQAVELLPEQDVFSPDVGEEKSDLAC